MASLLRGSLLRSSRAATVLTPALRRSYAKTPGLWQETKTEEVRKGLETSARPTQVPISSDSSILADRIEKFEHDDPHFAPDSSPKEAEVVEVPENSATHIKGLTSNGSTPADSQSLLDLAGGPIDYDPNDPRLLGDARIPIEIKSDDIQYIRVDEDRLIIKQHGRKAFTVLYHTLRDACRCTTCVDSSTKQRNFRTTDIPLDIKPQSIRVLGKLVTIYWDETAERGGIHKSSYTINLMKNGVLGPLLQSAASVRRWRHLWNRKEIEKIVHWIDYRDYMQEGEEFARALQSLAETGLIFVKNIPESRSEVEKLATRLGPLRNTFYGPTWDVRNKPNAENVAYTNQFLNFHMDLMYMNEPPGYQLLHCLKNSCDGGESLFADTFHVARSMYKSKRPLWKALTKMHLTYEYNHENHFYTNTWPVFQLEQPPPPEGVMRRVTRVHYSPPFQGRVTDRYADPQEWALATRALKYFAQKLEDPRNAFELKLDPGQCVIFENTRVVHARRAFNTNQGDRWLAGAYVDEDAVLSRIRTAARSQAHRGLWLNRNYGPMLPKGPDQAERNKNPDAWQMNIWNRSQVGGSFH
ncbi:putative Gamma-butyrobetaine hydroxylase subfamily [Aspergillus saccharolyticus JOP 1030-1]|uniref:Clavaminate synthase-like protein n=1 Tax=Aspergillus saccharolyticus JOP 1030-1 TaxID=1450539 RepID=A0A318ZUH4_9EURO|nr:Clavaminate synthase-like protein [Aspergillus saccharolyticus JOP 1030-1]PYH47993.1 Clavaminate synthase-like protein [Aspergillus saccharolyticus JOP 1030-1]